MTSAATTVVRRRPRVVGVDVARGLALLGMIATHVFGTLDDNGDPTTAHVVAGGRAATTFVLVAGVSLAFLSGGRRAVRGRERVAVSAGLVVRALLVGALGLAASSLSDANDIDVILQFYAVLFLLAIPLLGCAPMVLIGIAAAVIALGPALLVLTADAGLPYAGSEAEPTFGTLLQDPGGLLVQLFLTGEYPVVVYLAYLCVGLAIGRLDLRSPRLAWLLLGAGAALALAARLVSAVLLHTMGGLDRLIEQAGLSDDPADASALLWEPEKSSSWWYLALPAPHSHTPIDLLHTLGSATAVLGAALLLTRVPAVGRALAPLAAAGAMSLTLYSAHLVLLATGVQYDQPELTFLAMVAGALVFASAWRYLVGQGPLEVLVATASTAARRVVASLAPPPPRRTGPRGAGRRTTAGRGGAQLLAPIACAAVLALTFWAGTRLAEAGHATGGDAASRDAAVEVTDLADASVSDLADATDDSAPDSAPDSETVDEAPEPAPAPPSSGPPAVVPDADAERYCRLTEQLDTLHDVHPDQPGVIVEEAGALLAEMRQAAPSEIRDAVGLVVDDLRAEAGVPGANAPGEDALTRAEADVDAFDDRRC